MDRHGHPIAVYRDKWILLRGNTTDYRSISQWSLEELENAPEHAIWRANVLFAGRDANSTRYSAGMHALSFRMGGSRHIVDPSPEYTTLNLMFDIS